MTPQQRYKLNHPDRVKEQKRSYRQRNKDKRLEYQRQSRTPEHQRKLHLRHKFKITPEEYDLMLQQQGGVCAICHQGEVRLNRNGEIRRLAIDHNHETGEIRGLLCGACNTALGLFKDDKLLLEAAREYLC